MKDSFFVEADGRLLFCGRTHRLHAQFLFSGARSQKCQLDDLFLKALPRISQLRISSRFWDSRPLLALGHCPLNMDVWLWCLASWVLLLLLVVVRPARGKQAARSRCLSRFPAAQADLLRRLPLSDGVKLS
ncbi:hypothetical protein BU16DRAFT_147821 [Lophium mytilinum]|uniref:Uncharacterized protein n=1 Tax=Lophium mytilinum TaxID=390894 RepID=A0A6A6QDP3_9PEZI|nr:hypothetical protein BU16DRAFT_147821 [Lophium mytilinum]